MIILNGAKFAKNEKEFKNSIFEKNTCAGYYKILKNSISILDHNKNKIGVINKNGVLGSATKLDNGKYWYSYATIKLIGKYDSFTKSIEEPKKYSDKYLNNKI